MITARGESTTCVSVAVSEVAPICALSQDPLSAIRKQLRKATSLEISLLKFPEFAVTNWAPKCRRRPWNRSAEFLQQNSLFQFDAAMLRPFSC